MIACEDLDALLLGEDEHQAFEGAAEKVDSLFTERREFINLGFDLDLAYWAFRKCQSYEAWQSLGEWIQTRKPDLGHGVKDRFEYGSALTQDDFEQASSVRKTIRDNLEGLIGENGLLVFPTVPSCAPLKTDSEESLQAFREQALILLCLSGLSGLPQITIPMTEVHGAPMGLSLLGPRGSDKRLIEIMRRLMA